MRLPLSWWHADLDVSSYHDSGEPSMSVKFERDMLLVGTEVRWVDADGNPCMASATDAVEQERFSITTAWKDVKK